MTVSDTTVHLPRSKSKTFQLYALHEQLHRLAARSWTQHVEEEKPPAAPHLLPYFKTPRRHRCRVTVSQSTSAGSPVWTHASPFSHLDFNLLLTSPTHHLVRVIRQDAGGGRLSSIIFFKQSDLIIGDTIVQLHSENALKVCWRPSHCDSSGSTLCWKCRQKVPKYSDDKYWWIIRMVCNFTKQNAWFLVKIG